MLTQLLVPLLLRIAPGYGLGLLALIALPRQRVELRLAVYLLLFTLFRDAMTPMGLWTISLGGTIRFLHDPVVLIDLGLLSFTAVFVINAFEPDLARVLVWVKGKLHWALLAGLLGAALVVGPVALLRHTLLPEVPLPPVPTWDLGPLLAMALAGNFLEEVLFRGYLQGLVERVSSPVRAALASGVVFALFHAPLATTVTNVGSTLLAFVWFEGTVAAFVRMRFGVIASTLTHGLAIFVLASGLV